jgi:hypothetical protein
VEERSSGHPSSTRRLQFDTLTMMTTTGDGGSGGGSDDDDGDDDDDGGHDDRGHDDGGDTGPSSGLRKPYQHRPSMLPDPQPLPGHRTEITPVGKT